MLGERRHNSNTGKNEFVISCNVSLTQALHAIAAANGVSVQSLIRDGIRHIVKTYSEEANNDHSSTRSK
ncbi:hypothetical protein ACTVOR_03455 [Serratia nevei]|uniref:hypothetical protein n=1 Tax=Serratia nevei TaxID=2703794 RepID=UPI001A2D47F5|nr:hypothetical protein [Serratia marcescens]